MQAEVQRGTKPRPSPFCSVTQQHGGEEGASGRTGRKTGAALSSSAMAPKETGYKAAQDATRLRNGQILPNIQLKLSLLRHATRFPNGQILPNIPLDSFFCVTLPASRTGRLCQAYHHTHSLALPYPLPERADSVKHITTLFPLRYPTRCRNGQTRPKIPPHSFFCVTLPVSRMQIPPNMPQHSFFCTTLPAARIGRFCKTLFLLRSHV